MRSSRNARIAHANDSIFSCASATLESCQPSISYILREKKYIYTQTYMRAYMCAKIRMNAYMPYASCLMIFSDGYIRNEFLRMCASERG